MGFGKRGGGVDFGSFLLARGVQGLGLLRQGFGVWEFRGASVGIEAQPNVVWPGTAWIFVDP